MPTALFVTAVLMGWCMRSRNRGPRFWSQAWDWSQFAQLQAWCSIPTALLSSFVSDPLIDLCKFLLPWLCEIVETARDKCCRCATDLLQQALLVATAMSTSKYELVLEVIKIAAYLCFVPCMIPTIFFHPEVLLCILMICIRKMWDQKDIKTMVSHLWQRPNAFLRNGCRLWKFKFIWRWKQSSNFCLHCSLENSRDSAVWLLQYCNGDSSQLQQSHFSLITSSSAMCVTFSTLFYK